ncbi:hypothetical protein GCM10023321_39070 [Pseudonocardia eucalypti]|uniref:Pyrroloquinoline-quinone binding quinoprotein n=2 Tax=Pseudonocardia eucalypti TaxID=648755 RepID=A0ABP9QA21_9PSEU
MAIVAVLAVLACLIAFYSQAARTTSTTAPGPAPAAPDPPVDAPATVTEAWRAPSAATVAPVVVGPTLVTGDGPDTVGRDPVTGVQRWAYRRDLQLCVVGSGWGLALAVYRNGAYCSEVTALQAGSGERGPTRTADAPDDAQLLDDGWMVTATGRNHLESWRSDLVETLEYGEVRSPAQPKTQPRAHCSHASVAISYARLGVLERCPGERGDRLTTFRQKDTEAEHPDEEASTPLSVAGTRLVALSKHRTAVLFPGTAGGAAKLSVRDEDGREVAGYPLDLPPADLAGDPPGGVTPTVTAHGIVLWWTGSRTIALSETELRPLWTLPGALGPGALLPLLAPADPAGPTERLLIPVPGGLAVTDPATGQVIRTIPVDRGGYQGPVLLGALGPMIFEQRGPELVALR